VDYEMAKGLVEFHEKAKSYDWEFTAGDQRPKYQTKYKIPAKGRDPFQYIDPRLHENGSGEG
jgi:hypothetical protein